MCETNIFHACTTFIAQSKSNRKTIVDSFSYVCLFDEVHAMRIYSKKNQKCSEKDRKANGDRNSKKETKIDRNRKKMKKQNTENGNARKTGLNWLQCTMSRRTCQTGQVLMLHRSRSIGKRVSEREREMAIAHRCRWFVRRTS